MGFSKKNIGKTPDLPIDPRIRDELSAAAADKRLACAVAFNIAHAAGRSPGDVGRHADALGIRLIKCQLGLFGYQPSNKIAKPKRPDNPEIEAAIRDAVTDGQISCDDLWRIAARFNRPKLSLGRACEAMGFKIANCQLGAF